MSEALMNQPILSLRGRSMSVQGLLVGMTALKASDFYLKAGSVVRFKISGRVTSFEGDSLTRDRMDHILSCFLSFNFKEQLHLT